MVRCSGEIHGERVVAFVDNIVVMFQHIPVRTLQMAKYGYNTHIKSELQEKESK